MGQKLIDLLYRVTSVETDEDVTAFKILEEYLSAPSERRIDITLAEQYQAGMCGLHRRITSSRMKINQNVHSSISDWDTEINGALAELAVAKFFGIYWSAGNMTFKQPDLMDGPFPYQVRSTTLLNGKLIIRENDNDLDTPYILAIPYNDRCADPPLVQVHIKGWITPREARLGGESSPYYVRDNRRHTWWVPQNKLHTDF